MLHRGKPIVYCSGNSGIGNRLRGLVGYWALSRCLEVPFSLCWQNNLGCEAEYPTLFARPALELVEQARAAEQARTGAANVFSRAAWFDSVWQEDGGASIPRGRFLEEVAACIREIAPHPAVREKVDRFSILHHLPARVGAHIRHTDNRQEYKNWKSVSAKFNMTKTSSLEGFYLALDSAAKSAPIFLATDNSTVERKCRKRYKERIVTYPKQYHRIPLWARLKARLRGRNEPRRTSSVEDAVTEMFLLSRCRCVLGTYYSSFSKFSAMLNGADYREIQSESCVEAPTSGSVDEILRIQANWRATKASETKDRGSARAAD
jgi:hypothetical protein